MHDTINNFGYPATLIADYSHWVVLLRPAQATLGACVLACKEPATAYGDISTEAAAQQGLVIAHIETALSAAFAYDKINYLMLMMVDPHVHFHVLPRYAAAPNFAGTTFADSGWPALPQLGEVTPTNDAQNAALVAHIKAHWPAG